MKSAIRYVICCVAMIMPVLSLNGAERVISTLNNVDLYEVEKFNADGNHFGTDLYVQNRNPYPVQVSIKMTNANNTRSGLIDVPFVIDPNGKGYFGWLAQEKKDLEGTWNVEWYVNKMEKAPTPQPTPVPVPNVATQPPLEPPPVQPAQPVQQPATTTPVK